VRERGVFEVGDDLFDDGVVAVGGLGGEHRFGAVGEHCVVAVAGEQLVLSAGRGGGGVEAAYRRTISRAVTCSVVRRAVNAVRVVSATSATSATEIRRCSWSSKMALG